MPSITELQKKLCRPQSSAAHHQFKGDCNLHYSRTEQTLTIGFTGTRNDQDRVDSYTWDSVPMKIIPEAPRVHRGFYRNYLRMRPWLLDTLSQYRHAQQIVVVGHSLGGAVALLCALDLSYRSKMPKVVLCHTIANPKVGMGGFTRQYARQVPNTHRWVKGGDYVPYLPPVPYQHVGELHWDRPSFPHMGEGRNQNQDHNLLQDWLA